MNYPIQSFYWYVKNEDAKEFLSRQRVMGWVMAIALMIVFGIFNVFIAPRMVEMYQEFGYEIPWYAESGLRTVIFVIGIAGILIVRPESDESIAAKLSKYKTGEMILMSKLRDWRYFYLVFGILLMSILYSIISIVLPIYDITSKV